VDYGVNFELVVIPDAAYALTLRCSVFPTDFALSTTSSASSLLRKDALISACGAMFGYLAIREVEYATFWKNEIISGLFKSSVASDHNAEDLIPVARPFNSGQLQSMFGEYYSNPLIRSVP
jgi:hypothetical protein